MPSMAYLMLRSARRAHLEARIDIDAGSRAPCSAASRGRQLGMTVRCGLMGKDQRASGGRGHRSSHSALGARFRGHDEKAGITYAELCKQVR